MPGFRHLDTPFKPAEFLQIVLDKDAEPGSLGLAGLAGLDVLGHVTHNGEDDRLESVLKSI